MPASEIGLIEMPVSSRSCTPAARSIAAAALKAHGITPKFIYTIPTIQNPTASILPLDRRHALIKLAREYNVAIFEDECYADLLWEGVEAPPALTRWIPAA